jgi:glycerophosphoryl diester phosphodiesterase
MNAAVVLVDAHRGASAWCPENTLSAFEAAIAFGADSVELDVQLSADGVPVVIHDDTVDRTTNGSGAVARLSAAELAVLDAGAWKSPSFKGERIPTLDQCLWLLAGTVRINLELKARDLRLADLVAAAIENRSLHRQVMVSSFHLELLAAVRKRLPGVRIHHFLEHELERDFFEREGRFVDSVGVAKDYLTPNVVAWFRAAGRPIWVWTVDDPAEALRFAAMGVESITTNDPGGIVAALTQAGYRAVPAPPVG